MSKNIKNLTRREFLRLCMLSSSSALVGCSFLKEDAVGLYQKTDIPAAPVIITGQPDELQVTQNTPSGSSNVADQTGVPAISGKPYLSVARGENPTAITQAAIAALGGMERFVKKDADVIIKPNICVDYHTFEYAATTNPQVIAALVQLCIAAGAKRVRVMDTPFGGRAETAYARSGIADAVSAAGGQMEVMNRNKYKEVPIPQGKDIKQWRIYQDIMDADVFINVPIAKHHSLARLSLGGKNLLGVIQKPGLIHANLGQRLADLVSVIRPTLTVVDAVRTLMAHGPSGGNLDDVRLTNTVIACPDIVAADAYAATLFGMEGSDISYIQAAADMGLGSLDLKSMRIEEINV